MADTKLYAWDADRDPRLACIEEAPFDDDGRDLLLFNGMPLDEHVTVNLQLPKQGVLADFLYSPLLKLFVSERVREVVARAHAPHVRVHPVVLRDRKGQAVDDAYSWINVMPLVDLLDRARSVYTEWDVGKGIRSVSHLVIRDDAVPADDLFLFKEINLPVFSARLVERLEAIHVTGAVFEDLDELTWPV